MNQIFNNINAKTLVSSKFRNISKPTGSLNCSLYLQQAGPDDVTNRFPKPAHGAMVEGLAKILTTFQGF